MPTDNNGRVRPDIKPAARVYRSTTQSITGGTPAAITFDTLVFDVGKMWDSASKLVIPRKGRYQINFSQGIAAGTHTLITLQIQVNGTSIAETVGYSAGLAVAPAIATIFSCSLGDYIQGFINHNALGNVNTAAKPSYVLTAHWVGEK